MALVKCPRCELNYMSDSDKFCTVCKRELHGEDVKDDVPELCTECGENPVVTGEELCYTCLREIARHSVIASAGDTPVVPAEDMLDNSVSGMDEIEIAVEDDIPDREYKEIDRELGEDEEEDVVEDDDELAPDSIEALVESEGEEDDDEREDM